MAASIPSEDPFPRSRTRVKDAEMAYVAYHFGWSRNDLFDLEHLERRRWVEEIARINAAGRES